MFFKNINDYISNNTGILIRLDDISENMNWHIMTKCQKLFLSLNIKPVLGVIPKNNDPYLLKFPKKKNFWSQVREWQSYNWTIAMHGYSHVYKTDTKKKDFFGYGGQSEFFGNSLQEQEKKIRLGLRKFMSENILIKTFFAPNHTYDLNTFKALKNCGIFEVIDGYGLMPFTKHGINFIPQLFYRNILLPFGIQSTQIHLNTWGEKDYNNFEKFIYKNQNKIICYNDAISKISNNFFYNTTNIFFEKILKLIRLL